MKSIMAILIICSALFGQQDTVYTRSHLYAGDIVQATSKNVYLSNDTFARTTIPVAKIQKLILKGGEVVIGQGISPTAYHAFLMGGMFSSEVATDTLAINNAVKLHKNDNLDRATIALERISIILGIQLGLGILLLLITLAQ